MTLSNVAPTLHPPCTHLAPTLRVLHPNLPQFCNPLKLNRNYPKFSHEKLTTPSPHSFESVVSFSTQLLGNFCLIFFSFIDFFNCKFFELWKGGKGRGLVVSALFCGPSIFCASRYRELYLCEGFIGLTGVVFLLYLVCSVERFFLLNKEAGRNNSKLPRGHNGYFYREIFSIS